jgi:sterol 3beta-glucosyltransferase
MRVTMVCVGSQGDVQPYIALGLGLQAAGHSVRLATHAEFEIFVRSYGLDFFLLEGNPRAVLESDAGQAWQRSSSNPVSYMRHLRRVAEPLIEKLTRDCLNACEPAEAVISSLLAFAPVHSVVEQLRVPVHGAYIQPNTPTRAFANYRFPRAPTWLRGAQGGYNKATHLLMEQFFWLMLRDPINEARRTVLALPPLGINSPAAHTRKEGRLHLYGYSKHVLPRPRDWSSWNHVTGYWFLDQPADWQPPAALVDFIESGPAPVYVGFGSMNSRDPEEVTDLVIKALARAGQRGLLLTGWGGLHQADLPDTVFKLDSIPHDWLFPRMAAIVHHGGSGTTAASLRAGVPSVVIPFFGDQPLWGRRVHLLDASPEPIPRKQLSVELLADAISDAVGNLEMREHAMALGEKIRAEDGVAVAVEAFNRHTCSKVRI